MDDRDRAELKEYIFQAVQSGKKETSDLADSILKKQEVHIEASINKYVNGHLKDVKKHLGEQDKTLLNIQLEQSRVAEELKKVKLITDPALESRLTIVNLGRFVVWVGKGLIWLGAISGATAAIIWLIDKLKDITK